MIETERLVLRPHAPGDRPAMMVQLRDPDVMRYLLPVPDDAAYDAMAERLRGYERDHGFTFWTVERRSDRVVIGTCGLKPGAAGTPIEGMVEIGWRLAREAWGHGYAREAAEATLGWAWRNLTVDCVAAITVAANSASWGLMQRLGMTRVEGGDFDHPGVVEGSPLRRHVMYTIDRPAASEPA